MSQTKHMAVLECNYLAESVQRKYGTYTTLYKNVFEKGVNYINQKYGKQYRLEVSGFDLQKSEFPSDDKLKKIDIILISGGVQSVYDKDDKTLLTENYIKRVNMMFPAIQWIGICLGHQMIAQAFNGKVERGIWEVGNSVVNLSALGKLVFDIERDEILMNQMHQDVIVETPSKFKILGYNDKCDNQIMANENFIAIQGHCEFNQDIIRQVIAKRVESKLITQVEADEYLKNNDNIEEEDVKAAGRLFYYCVEPMSRPLELRPERLS